MSGLSLLDFAPSASPAASPLISVAASPAGLLRRLGSFPGASADTAAKFEGEMDDLAESQHVLTPEFDGPESVQAAAPPARPTITRHIVHSPYYMGSPLSVDPSQETIRMPPPSASATRTAAVLAQVLPECSDGIGGKRAVCSSTPVRRPPRHAVDDTHSR
jgi:hypothetical protein